jgi:hypothetical protein
VDYLKGVLSIVAGNILALIGPGSLIGLRATIQGKATGIAVVWGAIPEAFLSFKFWILVLLLSAFFWAASRLSIRILRVALFWIPSILVVIIGVCFFILFAYLRIHFGRS